MQTFSVFRSGPGKWFPVLALGLALALPNTAWAQGKKKKEDKEAEQAYMLPYILTATAALLGLAVVCMPSQRKEEVDVPLGE